MLETLNGSICTAWFTAPLSLYIFPTRLLKKPMFQFLCCQERPTASVSRGALATQSPVSEYFAVPTVAFMYRLTPWPRTIFLSPSMPLVFEGPVGTYIGSLKLLGSFTEAYGFSKWM